MMFGDRGGSVEGDVAAAAGDDGIRLNDVLNDSSHCKLFTLCSGTRRLFSFGLLKQQQRVMFS